MSSAHRSPGHLRIIDAVTAIIARLHPKMHRRFRRQQESKMLYSFRHPLQAWRTRRRIRERLAAIRAATSVGLPLLWLGLQAAPLGNIA